jgi:geranylgeranyl pyrophosphate synthase
VDDLKDLYPEVRHTLRAALPSSWPELDTALAYLFEQPLLPEAMLPLASCSAVGGRARDAVPVAAALVAGVASVRVLDDLADRDRPGQLWQRVGLARASNYAAAAQALAFEVLHRAPLEARVIHRVGQVFARACLAIAAGQDRELAGHTRSLEDYWLTMQLRSGEAYGAACASGALVGPDDAARVEACRDFGRHLGLLMHILNDLESIWRPEGETDLAQTKLTLPVLYGLSVDNPETDELRSIVTSAALATRQARVKDILDHMQTRPFMVWAALQERDEALRSLSVCPDSIGKETLTAFITGVFGDIDQLLAEQ